MKHGPGCEGGAAAQVLRKLRRLPWREHEPYLVRTMLRATKGRYDDLPSVAALAGGLSQYHPSLGVALADALLEEVAAGLVMAVMPTSETTQKELAVCHPAVEKPI